MIHIASFAELGKALSVKRDKSEDDIQILTAKITVARLFINRETIDELLPMPIGWAARTLFDDQGAPLFKASLDLGKAEWTVSGQLSGSDDQTALSLSDGTLHGVALTLDKFGAFLSGSVSWAAAGDEVEDLADLLGRDVRAVLTLTDGGQADLFKAAA